MLQVNGITNLIWCLFLILVILVLLYFIFNMSYVNRFTSCLCLIYVLNCVSTHLLLVDCIFLDNSSGSIHLYGFFILSCPRCYYSSLYKIDNIYWKVANHIIYDPSKFISIYGEDIVKYYNRDLSIIIIHPDFDSDILAICGAYSDMDLRVLVGKYYSTLHK